MAYEKQISQGKKNANEQGLTEKEKHAMLPPRHLLMSLLVFKCLYLNINSEERVVQKIIVLGNSSLYFPKYISQL